MALYSFEIRPRIVEDDQGCTPQNSPCIQQSDPIAYRGHTASAFSNGGDREVNDKNKQRVS